MLERRLWSLPGNLRFSRAGFPYWRGKLKRNGDVSNMDLVRDLVNERVTIFLPGIRSRVLHHIAGTGTVLCVAKQR